FFRLLGKVAGLLHRPSVARQTSVLKIVFIVLLLVTTANIWLVMAPLYGFNTRAVADFLSETYVGFVINLALWLVRIWAVVLLVIVYRELGAFRSTASMAPKGTRLFWVPRAAVSVLRWMRRITGCSERKTELQA
ncbi:MAG: hypothetical protein FWD53_03755, partial [Phycisphaerales bacterium]|nr:hypothetical protein [Phycisphaerales bacterium]